MGAELCQAQSHFTMFDLLQVTDITPEGKLFQFHGLDVFNATDKVFAVSHNGDHSSVDIFQIKKRLLINKMLIKKKFDQNNILDQKIFDQQNIFNQKKYQIQFFKTVLRSP